MSDASPNPYSTPSELPAISADDPTHDALAGRGTRLAAAMLDGILLMIIVMPVQFMTGYIQRAQTQSASLAEQLLMSLVGLLVFLVLNGYLLASRGQTIGKAATKIQIVDFKTGGLLPFLRVYVYRYLWTLPLVIVILIIPGVIDDLLINVVIVIDMLMIFRSDKRCLHDLIAGSKVVGYRADRPHTLENPA